MTKEASNKSQNSNFQKKMYPSIASRKPCLRRLDNREESLLGTFIQWVDHDRARRGDRKSTDSLHRKGPVDDALVETDENKARVNYIKRNRSDTSENLPEREVFRENVSRLHENVHLSRPTTPQPCGTKIKEPDAYPDLDKYRIMYLLVRVEQQQEHLRQVLDNMERLGRPKAEIKNIVNARGAISKMHGYLIGVRDNDHVVLRQIGNRADLEEFLLTVESACSSIEELPVPGTSDDKMFRLMNHMDNITNRSVLKDAKTHVKLRRRKNTPPNCLHVMLKTLESSNLLDNTWKKLDVIRSPKTKNVQQELESTHKKSQENNKTTTQGTAKSNDKNQTTEKPRTNLPKITSHEKEETELVSLMRDIDDLMDDTGLTNGRDDNMLSYEVLMLGAGEKKHKSHSSKKLGGSQASKNSDIFIQELDKLLDECDTT